MVGSCIHSSKPSDFQRLYCMELVMNISFPLCHYGNFLTNNIFFMVDWSNSWKISIGLGFCFWGKMTPIQPTFLQELHIHILITIFDFLSKYHNIKSRNRFHGFSWNLYLLQATNTLCLLGEPTLWNILAHSAETQFQSPLDYHVAAVTAWSYPESFPSLGSDSSTFSK